MPTLIRSMMVNVYSCSSLHNFVLLARWNSQSKSVIWSLNCLSATWISTPWNLMQVWKSENKHTHTHTHTHRSIQPCPDLVPAWFILTTHTHSPTHAVRNKMKSCYSQGWKKSVTVLNKPHPSRKNNWELIYVSLISPAQLTELWRLELVECVQLRGSLSHALLHTLFPSNFENRMNVA